MPHEYFHIACKQNNISERVCSIKSISKTKFMFCFTFYNVMTTFKLHVWLTALFPWTALLDVISFCIEYV